jgi:hypothetical protein
VTLRRRMSAMATPTAETRDAEIARLRAQLAAARREREFLIEQLLAQQHRNRPPDRERAA